MNIDGKKIGETERVAAAVTVAFCFRVFGEKRLSEFASVGSFFSPATPESGKLYFSPCSLKKLTVQSSQFLKSYKVVS